MDTAGQRRSRPSARSAACLHHDDWLCAWRLPRPARGDSSLQRPAMPVALGWRPPLCGRVEAVGALLQRKQGLKIFLPLIALDDGGDAASH